MLVSVCVCLYVSMSVCVCLCVSLCRDEELECLREAFIIYTQILVSQALEPSFIASLLQEPGRQLCHNDEQCWQLSSSATSSGMRMNTTSSTSSSSSSMLAEQC